VRLLIISQDFGPKLGGIERYTLEIATQLSRRAQTVHVLCPDQSGAAAFDRTLPFEVRRVPCGSDALPLCAAPWALSLVAREGIDALLHTQWQTAPLGVALRRMGSLRALAIAAHGKELLLRPLRAHAGAQRAYDRLRRRCLESADVVLPVSRYTAGLVAAEAPRARCAVVPNGVDAERFVGGDGQAFRARFGLQRVRILLSVARLVPRKGIDHVLAALPDVVVGDGPDQARLRALVRAASLEERVHMLGTLDADALCDAYAACDAFVLVPRAEPDSVEGFGLVLLEAAAAGRPSVTSDAGGTAEAVRDGTTGLVVPACNPAALLAALHRVLGDSALAARLGAGGAAHARRAASWDRTAEALLAQLDPSTRGPSHSPPQTVSADARRTHL